MRKGNLKPSRYLSDTETPLQQAMYVMSLRSAWARWYSAQFLAMHSQPINEYSLLFTIANIKVLSELVEGRLTAYGRSPGKFEASAIPKHYWAYRCFDIQKDEKTL